MTASLYPSHHRQFNLIGAGIALLITLALCSAQTQAQTSTESSCGDPFRNHFGPWDYRTARKQDIDIVERNHFTPGIETLTKPVNTMMNDMAQDVAYTLGVFPNHHRALLVMVRLAEKYRTDPPAGTKITINCWFDRAVRFRPEDTVVRSIYAQYLGKQRRKDEAIQHLNFALQLSNENPISQYTIGTVFLELGEFDRALSLAHKSRAMGVQWPELEISLRASGHWKDPEKP